MQILVVDDDALITLMVSEGLKLQGYEVAIAENGATALAAVRKRRPALMLLDAEMPVMDGFAVLKALKAEPALNHVPVIMLTARRNARDVMLARGLGACDYLAKPFDILDLLQRVKTWAGKRPGVGSPARSGETSLVFGDASPDAAQWFVE
ncbi:MAG: response regulator transcription factor [Hyphomonadaceae bacterium]|nr:response regulator transcription factor [Hyphomonadaceae bacterium]